MTQEEALKKITDELVQKHHCHTIIVRQELPAKEGVGCYYELWAFREGAEPLRDMQALGEEEHTFSMFIHPQSAVEKNAADFLELSEGKILMEKGNFGKALIEKTKQLWKEGPDRLPDEEIKELKSMVLQVYNKLSAVQVGDRTRMDWLHKGLIEFYFLFRRLWYLDHKYGAEWLKQNDPQTYEILQKARRHTDPETMNENFKLMTDIVLAGEQG